MSETSIPSPPPPDEPKSGVAEAARRLAELQKQRQSAARPTLKAGDWLGLLLIGGMMALGWSWTFVEMWPKWFERWHRTELSLMQRLTEGNSYYTHAPLVPLVCLVICWFIYRRVGIPSDSTVDAGSKSSGRTVNPARAIGWVVLGGSLLLHVLASVSGVTFVSGFALVGVIAGMVLVWGGWTLFQAYWVPVFLLVFMIPLPEIAISNLNFYLKGVASDGAMWISTQLFSIPAYRQGSFVYLPSDVPDEAAKRLVVENVCSGLRSLISLTFFASMFALVCRVKGMWRVVMLLLAVPVAVVTNVIRIAGLIIMAHWHSVKVATEGGWFHDYSGIFVFILALGILFFLEYLILLAGAWLRRPWVDERLLGFLDRIRIDPASRASLLRPSVLVSLAVVTGLSLFYSSQIDQVHQGDVARDIAPNKILLAAEPFRGSSHRLSDLALDILQTNDYSYMIYQNERMSRRLDMLVIFSPNNRKGTHPPEVCLQGEGHTIADQSTIRTEVDGLGPVVFRKLVTEYDRRPFVFIYVYKAGGGYTPSFFVQQVSIFANAMLGRDAAGALVRFSAPVLNNDQDEAVRFLTEAAEVLMPDIHRGLARETRRQTGSNVETSAQP